MEEKPDSAKISYCCTEEDDGRMISELLRKAPLSLYSGTIRTLKQHGGILLNGAPVRVGTRVKAGDVLLLDLNAGELPPTIEAEEIPLEILYEDDALLALNKPADQIVHPTVFHPHGTLANGLAAYWKKRGIASGLHFVSRLDLGTSGILLVARNGYVQEHLRRQADAGVFRKTYVGLVWNDTLPALREADFRDTVDRPIARRPGSILEREINPDGDRAVTHFRVLQAACWQPFSLLSFELETGRTHQIRVHCASGGFPLAGDTLYGNRPLPSGLLFLSHQSLHAFAVTFRHPVTGEEKTLTAPLPADFRRACRLLGLPEDPLPFLR